MTMLEISVDACFSSILLIIPSARAEFKEFTCWMALLVEFYCWNCLKEMGWEQWLLGKQSLQSVSGLSFYACKLFGARVSNYLARE
jgi:hypothetical protein